MLLIINSKDRIQGSPSNFTYQFQYYGPERIREYRINKITIPYSWYNVREQQILINGDAYTIASGNYTPQTFITWWNSTIVPLLTTAITISYNLLTNVYTLTSLANFTIDFGLIDVPDAYSLKKIFGTTGNIGPTMSYTSGLLNFTSTSNIYLSSVALCQQANYFNKTRDMVFQSVPVDVNPMNYIIWQNSLPTYYEFNKTLNTFDISVLDDDGNVIDLNGQNLIFEIQCNF